MTVNLDILYKILAIGYYNGERRRIYHHLIKTYLQNPSDNFDINAEMDNLSMEITKDNMISDLFLSFDSMITSGLAPEKFLDYIKERYGPYEDTFQKRYGIPLSGFIYIAFELLFYVRKKIKGTIPIYQFQSKEEYADIKFIAYPSQEYINSFREAFTVDVEEFKTNLIDIGKPFIKKFIELYSFDIERVNKETDFRIKEYPLLYHNQSLILVDPSVYLRYIPHKIHLLLNGSKNYDAKKGKIFEKIALDLIEEVPYSNLEQRNLKYDGYELDGLLNLRRSTWFIECKSRNISTGSLKGEEKKISKDVERAIEDSIDQGKRAIDHRQSPEISKFKIKRITGIIIILEGIFPNIRLPKIMGPNPIDDCPYPVCVFNYFELKKILEQPDAHLFEEFLIWRSQSDMPIYAFDECDYWAFYNDNYRKNKEMKEAFRLAQEKHIVSTYISARFNKKSYLAKIAGLNK